MPKRGQTAVTSPVLFLYMIVFKKIGIVSE